MRNNLAAAGLTQAQWRERWESARLFLTADGEATKAWGNETIRVHPDEGWLEIKLPAPLAHLANRPHGRYRLSAPVAFRYRGDEVAAQAASGAVRYDISCDPGRGRWYLDASWKAAPVPAPSLGELRARPVVAVDVNHGHLAAVVIAADGNVLGVPATLAAAPAGAPPRNDRSPRGSTGDRATRARAPGQAPRDRDPHRPGGGGTASPGAAPDHPGAPDRTQETRRPTRPPAATRHQDQTASPDHGRQPGDPRPFGAVA
jgi:hypothetical protein